MKRPFNSKDRIVLIVDRVLIVIACFCFLWVQAVQRDFRWLIGGIVALLGLFFTSRHMLVNFKEDE